MGYRANDLFLCYASKDSSDISVSSIQAAVYIFGDKNNYHISRKDYPALHALFCLFGAKKAAGSSYVIIV